jgi:hypothetical protein
MTSLVYAVIGDLVGSRRPSVARATLQQELNRSLSEVNDMLGPTQPLEPTVGDEYQGTFATLADALTGTLLVRLSLHPQGDVRCGIGRGEVTVHDAERSPVLQDGPGWWAARKAIETIDTKRDDRRTWYAGPDEDAVNAFLLCRDQLVDRLNDRGLRMLRLGLTGRSQKEIAEAEGVWPSAVSQQFSRGIGAVLEAHRMLARWSGA